VVAPTKADRAKLKRKWPTTDSAFPASPWTWSFKKPGPSILDENPTPTWPFLGFTTFGSDLGIKTIRVDSVEPPDFLQTSKMDEAGTDRIVSVWDKCSKIAADHGMNVCWEFEPGFLFNKPSEILTIVDGVARRQCQLRRAVRHLPRAHAPSLPPTNRGKRRRCRAVKSNCCRSSRAR
jgi:hypothetical protein